MLALVAEQPIGIERYVRNVLGGIDLGKQLDRCFVRRGVDIGERLGQRFLQRHPSLETCSLLTGPTPLRILFEMFVLSWLARDADIVLSINNFGPLFGKRGQRRVVIIHDVWFMSDTYEGSRMHRWIFRILLATQLRRTHQILTISDFSRREIVRWFDLAESKVSLVQNCIRPSSVANDHNSDPLTDNTRFMLMIGSSRANKNIWRGIEGWCRYVTSAHDQSLELMIIGRFESDYGHRIKASFPALAERITLKGYVEDEELNQLYRRSIGVIFPSLYEGYGLPAVEAALHGKPVLLSEGTACAEELGDLAVCVDGRDIQQISDGVRTLLTTVVNVENSVFTKFREKQFDCALQSKTLASLLLAA